MLMMSYKKKEDKPTEKNKEEGPVQFGLKNLEDIMDFSSTLKNTEFTRLIFHGFAGEHLKHIAQGLNGNTTLQELLISHCDMDDESARHFGEFFKGSVIKFFSISYSTIDIVAAEHLARGLKETEVVDIDLTCEDINDPWLKPFVDLRKEGKTITVNLKHHKITATATEIVSQFSGPYKNVKVTFRADSAN